VLVLFLSRIAAPERHIVESCQCHRRNNGDIISN
jgi:hypothetical protein